VTENLSLLELDVEQARAKLAQDLAVLRSPETYREFSAGLKSEARSVLHLILDDLKARAATNPSAALAIGAGIGWRLFKNPPIATALIGAGILSLWRTTPIRMADEDYLAAARERFGEQVAEAVETVKDYAAEAATSTQEKASDYAQAVQQKIQGFADSAAEEAIERIEHAREAASRIPEQTVNAAQRATSQLGRTVGDPGVRDQVLLGVAGVAVAAALSLAYQRRTSDTFGASE
jgi:hypothetical protein